MPEGLPVTKRRPIPFSDIYKIQEKYRNQDDELRWIIALLSDTGMRLGESDRSAKKRYSLGWR